MKSAEIHFVHICTNCVWDCVVTAHIIFLPVFYRLWLGYSLIVQLRCRHFLSKGQTEWVPTECRKSVWYNRLLRSHWHTYLHRIPESSVIWRGQNHVFMEWKDNLSIATPSPSIFWGRSATKWSDLIWQCLVLLGLSLLSVRVHRMHPSLAVDAVQILLPLIRVIN